MTADEFHRYYDRLPVALLLATSEGLIESANPHAAELLDCSRQELEGRSLLELSSGDTRALRAYLNVCGGSRELLPGSMQLSGTELRVNGGSAGSGTGRVLLQLTSKFEMQRRFVALNEKIERLAIEVEDRRRAEALTAGQNEVLGLIARDAPLGEVLERLVLVLEAYAGPDVIASVLLLNEESRLTMGAAPRLPPEFARATEGVEIGPCVGSCGTAAWRRQPVAVRDIATDSLWAGFREVALRNGLRACWSVPIQSADGRVLGTVALYYGTARLPSERDWHVANIVMRTAAIAIERHCAAEKRRQLLERQAAMLDGLSAAIALVDASGRIRSVNQTWRMWARDAGPGPEALESGSDFVQVCDELFRTEGAPPVSQVLRAVSSGALPDFGGECRYETGGHPGWVRLTVAPLRDSSSNGGDVILMHVDVTDRRLAQESLLAHAEELMRVNAELQQFAYVASHDLREPLRTVKSFAQLFVRRYRDQLGPDADQYLGYISDGVTRMEDLIHDLLSYSQVAHAGQTVSETVDLHAVLHTVRQNLSAVIQETGAEISVDKLPAVQGNRTQLTQLFQNLIANAIKYRSALPPRIQVYADCEDQSCRIAVSDNGIGIPRQYHETIFGLFKRLHSRGIAGTGIGLTLCRKIAEQHGGTITVDSEPGKGSTFSVVIASARAVGVSQEAR